MRSTLWRCSCFAEPERKSLGTSQGLKICNLASQDAPQLPLADAMEAGISVVRHGISGFPQCRMLYKDPSEQILDD